MKKLPINRPSGRYVMIYYAYIMYIFENGFAGLLIINITSAGAVDREFFYISTLPELSQGLPELCQSLPELTQTSTASEGRRSSC